MKAWRIVSRLLARAPTENQTRTAAWIATEVSRLQRGEEIEPPWVQFPGTPSWSGAWRQGLGEHWRTVAWAPFWQGLTEAERRDYLQRWAPDDDWREYLATPAPGAPPT